ncbi:cell envelope integrity protein TolA [Roseateles amylovorans]|uniref:Cell envelope integrity protein TolA n=1 Tax=Roseateles amylovorans TaxID=2978473 RepID=A0ABY6B4X8_9BURK|nr:cell envelope integrity protein TolA [Roseateles amylovorans]UXH80294.1 cell envelope integrity protein TolA [Roseateles amylovorans]
MSTLVSRFHPDRDPLRPPPAPGLGRGFGFAVVAHILLVGALSFGVNWRSAPTPALEAELWSAIPQAAAPKEQLPPETPVEPKPKPEPPKPQEPTREEIQAQRDAEIAIAKAKERKQREDQELRDAEEKKRKLEQQKKDEADKKERDRKDAERKQDQAKKDDAAKQEKAKRDADALREKQRQENLQRIAGMAGATGAPNATGSALKSSGPSANYAGRIKARVRPNIVYNDPGGASNPEAEVEVRAAPDGTIVSRKIVKSSGLEDFDNAVLRALDKTEVLPRDTDGTVPRVMIITFRPRE